MTTPNIEVCSPAEAAAFIDRLLGRRRGEAGRFDLQGRIDAVCRDASGDIAWEVHQKNLVTDWGRGSFFNDGLTGAYSVVTSPSTEPPAAGRSFIGDTGSGAAGQQSAAFAGTWDGNTLTRSWVTAFAVPPANRQIGTVGLGAWSSQSGCYNLVAYTRLSPAKTQSTTQTLEVSYRITLIPIL